MIFQKEDLTGLNKLPQVTCKAWGQNKNHVLYKPAQLEPSQVGVNHTPYSSVRCVCVS